MKKLVAILIASAFAVAMAQNGTQTQTKAQEFEQIKAQLQMKLGDAIDKAAPEVEKARQACNALQEKCEGKGEAAKKQIMNQERAKVQAQLENAIAELKRVQAQVGSEVDQAKEQIQARLQEKIAEMKALQDRIQTQKGKTN
jgi:aminoglycoside phosphotransferase (APT) family kinase protein